MVKLKKRVLGCKSEGETFPLRLFFFIFWKSKFMVLSVPMLIWGEKSVKLGSSMGQFNDPLHTTSTGICFTNKRSPQSIIFWLSTIVSPP